MKSDDFWTACAEFNVISGHDIKKRLTIIEGTIKAFLFDGTHVGHPLRGCGHNSDAGKKFYFSGFCESIATKFGMEYL